MADVKITLALHGCLPDVFTINGRTAFAWEFGEGHDHDPGEAHEITEAKGCGNFQWGRYPEANPAILVRYELTTAEHSAICDQLEAELSVGQCGWCL